MVILHQFFKILNVCFWTLVTLCLLFLFIFSANLTPFTEHIVFYVLVALLVYQHNNKEISSCYWYYDNFYKVWKYVYNHGHYFLHYSAIVIKCWFLKVKFFLVCVEIFKHILSEKMPHVFAMLFLCFTLLKIFLMNSSQNFIRYWHRKL